MTQNFYPSPTKITRRLFFPSRNFIWASRGSEARSVYTSNYAVITSSATVTRHLMNTGELLCAAGDVFCCCAAAGQQKRRKLCSPPTTSIPTSSVWIPSELDPLTLCPLSPGPGPAPPSILLGTRRPVNFEAPDYRPRHADFTTANGKSALVAAVRLCCEKTPPN